MWKAEIDSGMFNDGKYNVYGGAAMGCAGVEPKLGLDSTRVMLLQKFVQDKMEPGSDKDKLWAKCVTAINKRLYQLRQNNKENSQIKGEPEDEQYTY